MAACSDDPHYERPSATGRVWLDPKKNVDVCLYKLRRFGFVVLSSSDEPPLERCRRVAQTLDLGAPYVPLMYRNRDVSANSPYVHIRREGNGHPSFNTSAAQALHVDGLLESIGVVRTTMLHCVRPAISGGDTLLLDAAGLWSAYLLAGGSMVLANDDVLLRRSSLPGLKLESLGPAFAWSPEGYWISRYSDGPTEHWNCAEAHKDELDATLSYFRERAARDGRWRLSLTLQAGETLILRNDRLAHGRTGFHDDPDAPRHMIRSLYLRAC